MQRTRHKSPCRLPIQAAPPNRLLLGLDQGVPPTAGNGPFVPFSQNSQLCEFLSSAGGRKLDLGETPSNQVKVLQAELKSAKERLAAAEARLFAEQSAKEHAVEAAKFQIRSEMQGKIEEAYDKGYDRCKNAITDSMKMMQDFKSAS